MNVNENTTEILNDLHKIVHDKITTVKDDKTQLQWTRQAIRIGELIVALEREKFLYLRVKRLETFIEELQAAFMKRKIEWRGG